MVRDTPSSEPVPIEAPTKRMFSRLLLFHTTMTAVFDFRHLNSLFVGFELLRVVRFYLSIQSADFLWPALCFLLGSSPCLKDICCSFVLDFPSDTPDLCLNNVECD